MGSALCTFNSNNIITSSVSNTTVSTMRRDNQIMRTVDNVRLASDTFEATHCKRDSGWRAGAKVTLVMGEVSGSGETHHLADDICCFLVPDIFVEPIFRTERATVVMNNSSSRIRSEAFQEYNV